MNVAGSLRRCRPVTCSLISALSGDRTNAVPGFSNAGSWKHKLLPEPVGRTTSTDSPRSAAATTSSFPSRKRSTPKRRRPTGTPKSSSGKNTTVVEQPGKSKRPAFDHSVRQRRLKIGMATGMTAITKRDQVGELIGATGAAGHEMMDIKIAD